MFLGFENIAAFPQKSDSPKLRRVTFFMSTCLPVYLLSQIIRHALQVGGWVNILHFDAIGYTEADGGIVENCPDTCLYKFVGYALRD